MHLGGLWYVGCIQPLVVYWPYTAPLRALLFKYTFKYSSHLQCSVCYCIIHWDTVSPTGLEQSLVGVCEG